MLLLNDCILDSFIGSSAVNRVLLPFASDPNLTRIDKNSSSNTLVWIDKGSYLPRRF